ncbi:MAG: hypothetical protein Kow0090_21970 [Myxococcota bacterium]
MTETTHPFSSMQEFMNNWVELQKNWFTTMSDLVSESPQHFFKGDPSGAFQKFFEVWLNTYKNSLEKLFFSFPFSDKGDLAEKVKNSFEVYFNFYRNWLDAMGKMKGKSPDEAYKIFYEQWLRAYTENFGDLMGEGAMKTFNDFVSNFLKFSGDEGNIFNRFSKYFSESVTESTEAWSDVMRHLPEKIAAALSGKADIKVAEEFYEDWKKAYESSVGRLLKIPPVGFTREMTEKYTRSIDSLIKYQGALAGFYFEMFRPGIEAVNEIANKAVELSKEEVSPESYRKFYNYAMSIYENKFDKLFKTDDFVKTINITLDASLDFWENYQKLVEEQLKTLPIPTRSEMNEVYQELYRMNKKLSELELTMRGGKKPVKEAKPAARKAAPAKKKAGR